MLVLAFRDEKAVLILLTMFNLERSKFSFITFVAYVNYKLENNHCR